MTLMAAIERCWDAATLDSFTRAIVADKLTYLSGGKLRRLHRALRQTRKVEGDIVEFGVALGGSGILLARNKGDARRFLGFDVFGMIPAPGSEKDDARSRERYETIRSGRSKGIAGDTYYGYRDDLFSEVKASFARYGVAPGGEKIMLYRGLFEKSWPTVSVSRIALAHIDCDWYDPVRFCLQAVADKLSEGGILVIDDYNDYEGCRAAVDEFLSKRSDFSFEPGANPFLRKKRWAARP